jgi:mutator protein MutT
MNNVACAILYRNGEVLLGRRSLHSSTYSNCWDFIGGHVEKGESLLEALTRELGEELSIVPTSATLIETIGEPDPGTNGEAVYYVFEVLGWEGEPTMLGDEHSELKWFSVADACSLPNLALAAYVPVLKRLSARQISN